MRVLKIKLLSSFRGHKLPNSRLVLGRILYLYKNWSMKIQIALTKTAEELIEFSAELGLKCQEKKRLMEKLRKLFNDYQKLSKQPKSRLSSTTFQKKLTFFLQKMNLQLNFTVNKNITPKLNEFETADLTDSDSDVLSIDAEKDATDDFCYSPLKKKVKGVAKKKILDVCLSSCFDRSKVTTRSGTLILASTLQAIGENPSNYSISKDTIRRMRNKNRKMLAQSIKDMFGNDDLYEIHWDGKLMADNALHKKTERLAIAVSSLSGKSKLLEIPKLINSTGLSQSNAVIEAIESWDITNGTRMICFDTTASNTGKYFKIVMIKVNKKLS